MGLREDYKVVERTTEILKEKSIAKALVDATAELEGLEKMWGMYSGDGLGHGINFLKLQISYLNELANGK